MLHPSWPNPCHVLRTALPLWRARCHICMVGNNAQGLGTTTGSSAVKLGEFWSHAMLRSLRWREIKEIFYKSLLSVQSSISKHAQKGARCFRWTFSRLLHPQKEKKSPQMLVLNFAVVPEGSFSRGLRKLFLKRLWWHLRSGLQRIKMTF